MIPTSRVAPENNANCSGAAPVQAVAVTFPVYEFPRDVHLAAICVPDAAMCMIQTLTLEATVRPQSRAQPVTVGSA